MKGSNPKGITPSQVCEQLEEHGYKGRVVSSRHLEDLREAVQGPHGAGSLDEGLYQKYLTGFVYGPPEDLQQTRSLIVVANPQPQLRFTFSWGGKRIPLIVPPTYVPCGRVDKELSDRLAAILAARGYHAAPALVPKKALAVHSGLAAYGRNNIAYVEGMGSFHRISAFFSDLPCDEDGWQDLQMMDRCLDCFACLNRCPSGAIEPDRFLIKAERCITYHNEHSSEIPFPAWLDASWHDCLVGCLRCQAACPENKDYLDWVEDAAEFSPEETALFLEGTPLEAFSPPALEKIKRWELDHLWDVLPRNLKVFVERAHT
jgi:epoxyqueuosine reductase